MPAAGNVHSADGWREVLEPVLARYRHKMKRRYFRGDAAFANPEIYEFLEAEGYKYTIRLPANSVLQERIAWLLKRPVGRPPHEVRRYYASFSYQAGSWNKPRRVVAKVEWHPGELFPRVGFIVTNMTRPAERVVAFYNQRGTAEQWIKEGKNAVTWTRLSCHSFKANAVRLQLHALAYNLANFLRTLALPAEVAQWSLSTLRDRLVKIGAKIVRHGRSVIFQMAEVMVSRDLFQKILAAIAALRPYAGSMLRLSARNGLSGCQPDTCLQLRAYRAGFSLRLRPPISRRGRWYRSGDITVAASVYSRLPFLRGGQLAGHPGNTGLTSRSSSAGPANFNRKRDIPV